jgi:hypothetical protein
VFKVLLLLLKFQLFQPFVTGSDKQDKTKWLVSWLPLLSYHCTDHSQFSQALYFI